MRSVQLCETGYWAFSALFFDIFAFWKKIGGISDGVALDRALGFVRVLLRRYLQVSTYR
jgi:hypothetical protein